jgi:organic hydroperoxide reductase OsmC/OhrA
MIMTEPYFYQTEVGWAGERKGELRAPSLPDIRVAAPPEFKGHENTWTPEHLFVAAVNSCFMTTFLAIAELSKLDFVGFSASATGKLEKAEGRGLAITEVTVRPRLTVRRGQDVERASRILEKAERNCLISNSISSTVLLKPEILVESAPEVRTAGA